MKRVFTLLMAVGMFGLIACSSPQQEKEGLENQSDQAITGISKGAEVMDESVDEISDVKKIPEHVCEESCKTTGCGGPRCGEKGHLCTIACKGNEDIENSNVTNEE